MSDMPRIVNQGSFNFWPLSIAERETVRDAAKRRCHGPRLSDDVAKSTWVLKRHRRPVPLTSRESQILQETTAAGRIDANLLIYGDAKVVLRPTVTSMLKRLWASPLAIFPVYELSETVYGRPVSLRAIRQTVFRINRAFENAGCPLFAYCHASTVYLRPRFRSFDRVMSEGRHAIANVV